MAGDGYIPIDQLSSQETNTPTAAGSDGFISIDKLGQGGDTTAQPSAMDYWVKNPAIAAGKALVGDVKDIGNAVTHPLDMLKGAIKPFQDVASDPQGNLQQLGKVMTDPGGDASYIGGQAKDMVMNHPLQTAAMALPGAEGAVGLAEKGIGAAKKVLSPEYADVLKEHTDNYRKILNPWKNIINSQNVDVNNASKTLAENGVIIKTDVNNKLDNTGGIKQLQDANKPLYDQANKILTSSPDKTFNLRQIGIQAQSGLGKTIKNGEERIAARKQIVDAIKAEISENGGSAIVDAPTLHRIKQGMYERAYDPLNPTSNNGARAIGGAIKTNIEKAFPNSGIKDINAQIGKRLEAQTLLEKTNGNPVQGGKLGQGVGRIVGGTVGTAAGGALGSIGGPVGIAGGAGVGGVVGQEAGANVVNYLNNPERLTTGMANKINSFKKPVVNNMPIDRGEDFSRRLPPPNNSRGGVVDAELVQKPMVTPAPQGPLRLNAPDIKPQNKAPNGLPFYTADESGRIKGTGFLMGEKRLTPQDVNDKLTMAEKPIGDRTNIEQLSDEDKKSAIKMNAEMAKEELKTIQSWRKSLSGTIKPSEFKKGEFQDSAKQMSWAKSNNEVKAMSLDDKASEFFNEHPEAWPQKFNGQPSDALGQVIKDLSNKGMAYHGYLRNVIASARKLK